MCEDSGIVLKGNPNKQEIIARMLSQTNPPESASARAASATAAASARSVSPSHHFTATASAKRSPPKRPEMVGDDPQTPTTPESDLRVEEFGRKGTVWFRTDF